MTEEQRRRLRAVKTFAQLIDFLRDELDWPIDQGHDEDDLTFDWSDDLGLKDEERVGIKEIKQLRPLETGQPWGIFFVNFEKKSLPIVILRRILNALVLKKRASANPAQQAAWQQRDLLFISAYGQESERQLTFAHFSEPTNDFDPSKATLRVLGWDDDDTSLKLDYVADTLKAKLTWPADTANLQDWRQRWSQAFELRHRQVIDTAADLALRLAELATRIRNRMLQVLPRESESGELRKLLKGFQAALIHDLNEARFADMYAQTITYGLFSAAVSRTVPGAGTAVHQGNVVDMVPVTNPFLREMLSSFLKAGGRRGKMDFDELGIQEVVDLLNDPKTHMEAVLRDFGNRTRGEDPVIHFYEEFLKAYDKKLKVQRGVFYTPRPVVSYIVRSVHELLQTEFGLADGLADTATWGEMLKKHPALKLPPLTDEPGEKHTISPDEPFVQILDPATGTATFLVEVIDVIHRTLAAKWKQQPLNDAQQRAAWNDYVPKHLLPRLHAFELMMAPYAIAHMKIGLKLAETGYRFGNEERARIYLTNALEPWVKQLPLIGFDALAHEAAAVNEIKRHKRFTVVIGNPPYAKSSGNRGEAAERLVQGYKDLVAGETNVQPLSDDYVKFIAYALKAAVDSRSVVGMVTNRSFLGGLIHRGMRKTLLATCSGVIITDLHGDSNVGEIIPNGELNANVFDITQGVAISVFTRNSDLPLAPTVVHTDIWGSRAQKCEALEGATKAAAYLTASDPYYFFTPKDLAWQSEQVGWLSIDKLFLVGGMGVKSRRDHFLIDMNREALHRRFRSLTLSRNIEATRATLGVTDNEQWTLESMRDLVEKVGVDMGIRPILYRPFDTRFIWYHREAIERGDSRWPVMKNVLPDRLSLLTSRQSVNGEFTSVFVARGLSEMKAAESTRGSYVFPLALATDGSDLAAKLGDDSNLRVDARLSDFRGAGPTEIVNYIYAVLHSPAYRARYAGALCIEFPKVPAACARVLLDKLTRLGGELVALHLLESPKLAHPITEFMGSPRPIVEKVSWSRDTVWVDKVQTTGFQGVPENVWNFHIGGYKVCEKWLKDRKGRTLSDDDIAHYQKIVVALSETIRLMAEIDRVIDAHGGWPAAFQTTTTP
ncbi:MAG: hypothetical protein IAE88_00375 [Rhodobacteraceae bacterium]|nr:hypothetical protein [Paracoccaceae bacterium]